MRAVLIRMAAVLLPAVLLAGCDLPSGPATGVYTLVSINGEALPVTNEFTVTESALLQLRPGGRLTYSVQSRCRTDLTGGRGCEMTNGGRYTTEATYSRSEGWINFGGGEIAARFDEGRVVFTFYCPPSQGVCPSSEMEFHR